MLLRRPDGADRISGHGLAVRIVWSFVTRQEGQPSKILKEIDSEKPHKQNVSERRLCVRHSPTTISS